MRGSPQVLLLARQVLGAFGRVGLAETEVDVGAGLNPVAVYDELCSTVEAEVRVPDPDPACQELLRPPVAGGCLAG